MTMNAFWKAQARRIDAMSLRERALMFVSLAVALVAVADAVVLSPRLAEQKALAASMRQQSAELDALRASLAPSHDEQADTPRGRLLRRLAETRSAVSRADAEIAQAQSASRGTGLMAVLERALSRHDRLTLVRVAASPPAAAASAALLPRRGVALVLRGSYADLTRYVADTETALPGLRWGELAIRNREGGTELAAEVYVAGDAR